MFLIPMNWYSQLHYRLIVAHGFGKMNMRLWAREAIESERRFRHSWAIDCEVRKIGRYEGNVFVEEIMTQPDKMWKFLMSNKAPLY